MTAEIIVKISFNRKIEYKSKKYITKKLYLFQSGLHCCSIISTKGILLTEVQAQLVDSDV